MTSRNVSSANWEFFPYSFSCMPDPDTYFLMSLLAEGRWREDQYLAHTSDGSSFWSKCQYKLPHGVRLEFSRNQALQTGPDHDWQNVTLQPDGIQKLPITIHFRWVAKDLCYEVIISDCDLQPFTYDQCGLVVTVILAKMSTYLYCVG